uniref:Uncharacterized protein n=1 Tax=Anguilla anguilla TaxID=7936 RepID=A0A0E9WY67_ANGAN
MNPKHNVQTCYGSTSPTILKSSLKVTTLHYTEQQSHFQFHLEQSRASNCVMWFWGPSNVIACAKESTCSSVVSPESITEVMTMSNDKYIWALQIAE